MGSSNVLRCQNFVAISVPFRASNIRVSIPQLPQGSRNCHLGCLLGHCAASAGVDALQRKIAHAITVSVEKFDVPVATNAYDIGSLIAFEMRRSEDGSRWLSHPAILQACSLMTLAVHIFEWGMLVINGRTEVPGWYGNHYAPIDHTYRPKIKNRFMTFSFQFLFQRLPWHIHENIRVIVVQPIVANDLSQPVCWNQSPMLLSKAI